MLATSCRETVSAFFNTPLICNRSVGLTEMRFQCPAQSGPLQVADFITEDLFHVPQRQSQTDP